MVDHPVSSFQSISYIISEYYDNTFVLKHSLTSLKHFRTRGLGHSSSGVLFNV